ncbi:hypothetical protein C8A03DRAFT_46881 [Achaetomium macrosporum]|uniref:Alpha/beta hydrolase fold-3 domain-containing protein n=1 Tax=Achaetomium macrosporum TaxID=79813 RepID=A0AAN7C445_9PEZI|nr:hypothetical protein C8A03DRAFT_46881 [Achaetomium macrosporum]
MTWLIQFIPELGEAPHLISSGDDTKQQYGILIGKLAATYSFPPPDETVATESLGLGDCEMRTYRFIYEGGFVMGSVGQEDQFCRPLSRHSRMPVVSVGYRLAPGFPFSGVLEGGVSNAEWVMDRYHRRTNLVFAVALRLINEGLADRDWGVGMLAAVTVHPHAVPHHTIKGKSAMLSVLEGYGASLANPYLSILFHPRLKLLRSGGAGESRGVPVNYDAYSGYPHYSWLFPLPHLAEHQKEFFGSFLAGLQWVKGNWSLARRV